MTYGNCLQIHNKMSGGGKKTFVLPTPWILFSQTILFLCIGLCGIVYALAACTESSCIFVAV